MTDVSTTTTTSPIEGSIAAVIAARTEQITVFAAAIRAALGPHATEHHTPVGGYEWTWTTRGLWTLTAGGALDPEPVLTGPGGQWQCSVTALAAADLVLLMLHLAEAMPVGAGTPLRANRGTVMPLLGPDRPAPKLALQPPRPRPSGHPHPAQPDTDGNPGGAKPVVPSL